MAFQGYLKQSTAVTVKFGPFVDDTDGNTEETTLTITAADVRLSKNGGNMAAKNEATALTHDEIGVYDCDFDATDTGTVGILRAQVHESGALLVDETWQVLEEAIFDALFGASATGLLPANMTQILGTTLTEGTAGRVAGNFSTGYNNADAASTKVQDDWGSAVLSLPQSFSAISQDLTAGIIISGGFADTVVPTIDDGTEVILDGDAIYELNFSIGSGNTPFEVVSDIQIQLGGNRSALYEIFNQTLVQWDLLDTILSTGGVQRRFVHRSFPSGTPGDYVTAGGVVELRYNSNDMNTNERINVGFAQVSAVTSQGTVPTASEIAVAVEILQRGIHGVGIWEGGVLAATSIDVVTSQTVFTILVGPTNDDALNGFFAKLTDLSSPEVVDIREVDDYVGATKTVTLKNAPSFTIASGDLFGLTILSSFSDIQEILGDPQSAADLKDLVDDGYDPATNKIEGVKLVDVTTTNTDVRGTDGVDTATMRGTDGVDTAAMRGTDGVFVLSAIAGARQEAGLSTEALFTVNTTSFAPVSAADTQFEVDFTNDPSITFGTDQLKGRTILFERATTTAGLRLQGATILASSAGAGGDVKLTVDLLATALPVSGDTLVMI